MIFFPFNNLDDEDCEDFDEDEDDCSCDEEDDEVDSKAVNEANVNAIGF